MGVVWEVAVVVDRDGVECAVQLCGRFGVSLSSFDGEGGRGRVNGAAQHGTFSSVNRICASIP